MLTLSESKLAEIHGRASLASPGPWSYDTGNTPLADTGDYLAYAQVNAGPRTVCHMENPDDRQADRDGAFIAMARQDVEMLLLEVRRLQEELKRHHSDEGRKA